MVIYLSGPMSNLPEHNFPEFNKWAAHLRKLGHQVLNPAENDGGSTDKTYGFYFELDINNLLIAEAVVLLHNWEFSRGARLEVAIARTINRPIYLLDEFLKNRRPIPILPEVTILITT